MLAYFIAPIESFVNCNLAASRLIICSAICAALSSPHAYSNDSFQPFGASLTRSKVSVPSDPGSSMNNPAAASHFMKGKSGFRYNFIGPVGAGYELGQIDSLVDELDELIDILENEDLSAQEALDAKDRFDPFLQSAAVNGMIKVGGNAALPFFPMFYHNNEFGTFTAEITFAGSLRSTVLDDRIQIVSVNDSFKINTQAAVYVKSAAKANLGLGWSRPIFKTEQGLLHGGVKLNINQYELAKNVISLAGLEDGEDIGDAIKDDYENNAASSTNIALDAGLLWISKRYSIGLALNDINEPEYDYGSLASNCSGLSGISLDNCFVAQDAIAQGRIRADEVYVANAQATVEASTWVAASWLGKGTRWGFHSALDLNEKNDAIGDLYQWASVGATAEFNNWLVPEFRMGYSKNLSGTELSYYSVGVTFFKHADLDIKWSDESVEVDDSRAPRSAFFSFAIQTKF